jgi:glycine/D-amino acid oxidase-like deaminating enzyme
VTGTDFGTNEHPDASMEEGARLLKNAEKYIEKLKGVPVESMTLGYRVLPADGNPIVGFPDRRPNLYIAAMHSGMTMSPIMGQLAAVEILDGTATDLLAPYRLARFK